jgi:hypothetical protein
MKANIQEKRILKALQVIERMKEGRSIIEACRDIGIRTSTLEVVCEENPEIFDKLREIFAANGQRALELFTAYSNEFKQELEVDGLTDITDILPRLKGKRQVVG